MKISQKKRILTNFENCNDNLWTPCILTGKQCICPIKIYKDNKLRKTYR